MGVVFFCGNEAQVHFQLRQVRIASCTWRAVRADRILAVSVERVRQELRLLKCMAEPLGDHWEAGLHTEAQRQLMRVV